MDKTSPGSVVWNTSGDCCFFCSPASRYFRDVGCGTGRSGNGTHIDRADAQKFFCPLPQTGNAARKMYRVGDADLCQYSCLASRGRVPRKFECRICLVCADLCVCALFQRLVCRCTQRYARLVVLHIYALPRRIDAFAELPFAFKCYDAECRNIEIVRVERHLFRNFTCLARFEYRHNRCVQRNKSTGCLYIDRLYRSGNIA